MTLTAARDLSALVPAYALAIFDGDDGDAAGDDAGQSAAAASTATATQSNADASSASRASRDNRGRFSPITAEGDDVSAYRRALDEANRRLQGADERIGELNQENQKHRSRLNETRSELQGVRSMVDASNQRVIRAEARDALRDAGAISPRIVDLFLADMADKVKIDAKTGEPVGIRGESLETWRSANPDFFKPATGAVTSDAVASGDGKANDAGSGDGQSGVKRNSTSSGATPTGGQDGTPSNGGLGDLRGLEPKERAARIAAYKQSLRAGRPG